MSIISKKTKKNFFFFLFFVFLTLGFFKDWFIFKPLSAGDWPFLFKETIQDFSWPFFVRPGGYPPLDFFFQATAKIFDGLGYSWPLIERLVWFWPFLILTIFSSWYLAKTLFPKNVFRFLSPLVFLLNTYILMVVGGGQIGVAMAYALAPLVFGIFVKSAQSPNTKFKIIAGLVLALQVMFDPRVSLLTVVALVVYLLFAIRSAVISLIIPIVIAFLLHSYWLLPTVLTGRTALPLGYREPGWVEFLSFADFSNSLSLLHPNWPENIFGKTYFMRPEFLILPMLAFSSLLFIHQLTSSRVKELKNSLIINSLINNKIILFFNLLALVGAFLAKGSKPPFGGVYLWLFNHFPGMKMFRDPTKFYLWVALSCSILIPFSLGEIAKRFKKLYPIPYTLFAIFLLYWLFLIRPAWLGQLSGTFKAKTVPPEYVVLKDFLHNEEEFFRTLWIPKNQRFGFSSQKHPAIESPEMLSEEELTAQEVKYIIIPFDSEEEIFLEDRKYDPQQRLGLEEELDDVSWLKKLDLTERIAVYQFIR